jgi:RNA polymerase sigma factor (TIGR02999 family)
MKSAYVGNDIMLRHAMSEESPSLPPQTIAGLMARLRNGNAEAASELVEQLYPELRRIAAAKLARQRNNHSWQPTLLVHELYLELTRMKGLRPAAEDGQNAAREKATFLGLAGIMMQRRLIEHARPLAYKAPKLDLEALGDLAGDRGDYDSVQYVEDLLTRLDAFDPKLRTVLECKVFMGMTLSEIGAQLGCSERTAASYWALARRWLTSELESGCASLSLSRSPDPKN